MRHVKSLKFKVVGLFFVLVAFFVALPVLMYAASEFENPLKGGGINTIEQFVEMFLSAVLYVLFPIAVLFVVYSGFLYVTAQGNSEKISKAHQNFFWTIIGVALLLGATVLAALVRGTLAQITG